MKFSKLAFLILAGLFLSFTGTKAQHVSDPTTWTYELKKKSATEYQLVFHVKLEKTWHIWSVKPGGDGFQVVPSFVFDKNAGVKVKGPVKEVGKKITEKMEGIDGAVSFYGDKVDYMLTVTVKAGTTKITGKHEYQVCNDMMCLPPTKKSFFFEIKS